MPTYAYAILGVGWLAWLIPFVLAKRSAEPASTVDRRARWGVLLVAVAYSILWQNRFWERPLPTWRLGASVLFLALAALLSWISARALGRQWRIDAGLNPDHELVTSGPYRWVRHPIYTSMLCLILSTGFLVTPVVVLGVAIIVFMSGTQIRVRIEDQLLAARFGDQFREYRRTIPAYIPFLK